MKKNHWLICIVAIAVALGILLFVPKSNWGTAAIILICPAMHLFMMNDHGDHQHCKKEEKKS